MSLATLLPFSRAVFYDANGNPLAGGFVHTYVPGGSTPKTTWQDAGEAVANANPITLDADGSCLLFGAGDYQITVTDALGNSIPAYTGLTSSFASAALIPVVTAATTFAAMVALGAAPSFANVVALRALNGPVPPVVYVEGLSTTADGGEGTFLYVSTDSTSADDGWYIVVDGAGHRWHRAAPSSAPRRVSQSGTSYSPVAADNGHLISRSNSGTLMVDTLPGTGGGVLAANWTAKIANADTTAMLVIQLGAGAGMVGTGNNAISGTGAATRLYLGPGQSASFLWDGATYYVTAQQTRARCNTALDIFVATTGSDSNHGLSAGASVLTVSRALYLLYQIFDHNGLTPTINLADGTYAAGQPGVLEVKGAPVGSAQFNVVGNTNTPTNVILSGTNAGAVLAGGAVFVNLDSMRLQATGASGPFSIAGIGITAYNGAEVNFQHVDFGACATSHIDSTAGATVNGLGQTYTISGNTPYHVAASQDGVVIIASSGVTISNAPNFTAFVACDSASTVYAPGMTFSGAAGGARYALTSLGIIETVGGGATYFPGNAPGTNDGTGIYT